MRLAFDDTAYRTVMASAIDPWGYFTRRTHGNLEAGSAACYVDVELGTQGGDADG